MGAVSRTLDSPEHKMVKRDKETNEEVGLLSDMPLIQ
jgi:hypothetical protein